MKRIEPAGDHSVRVWMEQAPFDTLAGWLDELNRSYGVHVQLIALDREAGPGRVNARITLEGAGS
jgi:general secretion pathway protein M